MLRPARVEFLCVSIVPLAFVPENEAMGVPFGFLGDRTLPPYCARLRAVAGERLVYGGAMKAQPGQAV